MNSFDKAIRFDKAIEMATSKIEEYYFKLPIADGDRVFRERVYCYELYHQMRLSKLFDNKDFILSGEVDKSGHPSLPSGQKRILDFIVHSPGRMKNYAVIEVKPARTFSDGKRSEVCNAFKSLLYFTKEFLYKRAIFLVFGKPNKDLNDVLKRYCIPNGIEIWHHKEVKKPARWLDNLSSPESRRLNKS